MGSRQWRTAGQHRSDFPRTRPSACQQVSEFVALGLHIACVFLVSRLDDRHALVHAEAVAFKANHLARIVRDRSDGLETEVKQDLRADPVLAKVGLEAESLIGFDSIR